MASFELAIIPVLRAEGYQRGKTIGYVDHPADHGKETVAGISRFFWPNAKIWPILDAARKSADFSKTLANDVHFFDLICAFYKENFWDKIKGDNIRTQSHANQLVSTAVLEGIVPAVKRSQHIVHLPETGKVDDQLIKLLSLLP